MQIQIELGPEYQKTVASMTQMGQAVAEATSRGLGLAVKHAAENVCEKYITGNLLKTRSGLLKKATQGWKESAYEGIVGVREGSAVEKYKYLLGGGPDFRIKPAAGGRLLSIPLTDAKTGSGVLKSEYAVGLRNIDGGFFKEFNGKLFFVKHQGKTKRSKLLFLFVMAPSVKAHPTDALALGVVDATDGMTEILNDEVGSAISGN